MNNSIYPCLTIKNQIKEAAAFYTDVFGEGRILQNSPWATQIELSGQKFLLLNDGPSSLPNPSVSFMVVSENANETEEYWNKLAEGGTVLMALGSYEWSNKYGWIQDRYGISWQLYTGSRSESPRKFCPVFMFTGLNCGKATEAIHFYTRIFQQSALGGILTYGKDGGDKPELVKHAQFTISDFIVMAMDSSFNHGFGFNDAISLVVECHTQEEIDALWEHLTAEGGREVACGWLTDRYGISWQIIPKVLGKLISQPGRAEAVMKELMKMKKIVIATLENVGKE